VFEVRKTAKAVLMVLGGVVVFEVVDTALHMWAWRSHDPRVRHLVTRYNKCATNRLMLPFSGRSGSSAIVHHVGRRSGTSYATPVIAHQSEDDVIIPLPYGTDVDWLRNCWQPGTLSSTCEVSASGSTSRRWWTSTT
jgi:hypothetical protein